MRNIRIILVFSSIVFIITLSGCNKKKKEEENRLTPLNAPAKYGETMGKAMKKAKIMDIILPLKSAIDTFYIEEERYPESLQELVDKGYIKEIPKPPEGMNYYYNSKNGKIEVK
ncbi:hypothetical protein J7K25_02985 [bacterium]|nr:hypothetical protein [bacterium]